MILKKTRKNKSPWQTCRCDCKRHVATFRRTTSGQKELPTSMLCADEYLRLAYHGLRAKDNSFNVEL